MAGLDILNSPSFIFSSNHDNGAMAGAAPAIDRKRSASEEDELTAWQRCITGSIRIPAYRKTGPSGSHTFNVDQAESRCQVNLEERYQHVNGQQD